MSTTKKKVIVTGGAGYIGSHTVIELIEAGFEPIIIDNFSNSSDITKSRIEKIVNQEVKQYNIDCNNLELLKEVFVNEKTIDAVIHFAASKYVGESTKEPLKYYRNNISSITNILECMSLYNVRNFIFSSSCTVYGITDELQVNESLPMKRTTSPYGRTKQMCEEIIDDWMQTTTNQSSIKLRYFNPIGAHPSALIGEDAGKTAENLLPYLLKAVSGEKPLTIYGNDYPTKDGTCVRDYIHVMDLAKAHVKALEWLHEQPDHTNEAFNVGIGNGVSVLELVTYFEEKNSIKVPYEFGPRRNGDIPAIYANPSKVISTIKWEPQYTIGDALEHAWKWHQYKENKTTI